MIVIPTVRRRPWGIVCLVLNLLPGIGTMVAAYQAAHRWSWLFGILQLLTAAAGIGVLWSVVWGILIFRASG
jgi:hypothetical protein